VRPLRFSPQQYEAIAGLSQALGLPRQPLPAFRRLLLASLADRDPELAREVAQLGSDRFQLLYQHFQRRPQAKAEHGLGSEEVKAVAHAGGGLFSKARFARDLRRALVQLLRGGRPELAARLERMSLRQFEELCEEVKKRA
jgi:hypothetical protein